MEQRTLLSFPPGKIRFFSHLIASTALIALVLFLFWWAYKIWTH